MIELLEVSKENNIYSSLILHKINDEIFRLRFGIEKIDYGLLKRILEFRPFENTGVAPYKYYFALSLRKDMENESLGFTDIRVEQLENHKQFEFKLSRKYIANILWFNSLTEKKDIEKFIEKQNKTAHNST